MSHLTSPPSVSAPVPKPLLFSASKNPLLLLLLFPRVPAPIFSSVADGFRSLLFWLQPPSPRDRCVSNPNSSSRALGAPNSISDGSSDSKLGEKRAEIDEIKKNEESVDLGIKASFGESVLEFDGRERLVFSLARPEILLEPCSTTQAQLRRAHIQITRDADTDPSSAFSNCLRMRTGM